MAEDELHGDEMDVGADGADGADDDDLQFDPNDILEVIEVNEGEDASEALAAALERHGLHAGDGDDGADGADGDDQGDDDDDQGGDDDDDDDDVQDDSVGHFRGHTQPIFAVAAHGDLAVTGGEDDLGLLWRIDTQEIVARLDGHTDSVVAVGFSHDGKYVASAAMDGAIRVWLTAEAGKLVVELNCGDDLTNIAWHPKANFLLAGTASGAAYMFTVPNGDMSYFGGHQAPVTALTWAPDGRTFITASEEGSLISWSPKSAQILVQIDAKTYQFHQAGITAVACAPDNTLVVSGAQDGSVVLVQIKTGKVLGQLAGAADSIETIAISTSEPVLVATGCLDGVVRVYEPFKMSLRFACQHDGGVVLLKWLPTKPVIVSASLDRTVRVWDGRDGKPLQVLHGHTREILGFALASGDRVISAGDDSQALLFPLLQAAAPAAQ